jgi:RTA1 like protein
MHLMPSHALTRSKLFRYRPSSILAILGAVLFGISFLLHGYRLFRHRSWYFSPVMLGAGMEVVGYAFRLLSARVNPYSVLNFVIQYFFIVVAPIFFSAAIYTVLTVLITRTRREYAPLGPKMILWIFITCDVVATITQVAGAALIGVAASNRKDPTMANNILLAGLAFQVFSFFVFCVFLGITLFRARKIVLSSLKAFTAALCLATFFIYVRTCFRLAETAEGLTSALATKEVFFGCLEFAPIVIAVYILAVWHPGKYLPRHPTWDVNP